MCGLDYMNNLHVFLSKAFSQLIESKTLLAGAIVMGNLQIPVNYVFTHGVSKWHTWKLVCGPINSSGSLFLSG